MPMCPQRPWPWLPAGLPWRRGGQDFIQVFRAGVVELVQVNVIGAQVFQADGKLGFHLCLGQRTALGGKDKFIPQAQFLQRLADPLLADGVSAGGINVIDARLMARLSAWRGCQVHQCAAPECRQSPGAKPAARCGQNQHTAYFILPFCGGGALPRLDGCAKYHYYSRQGFTCHVFWQFFIDFTPAVR